MTDKYISNIDLERFSRFLNLDRDAIMYERDINTALDIQKLFDNTNAYFCILFKVSPDPKQQIGHWTCLIKHSETKYEYFDCLGDPIPDNIVFAIKQLGATELLYLDKNLMDKSGTVCGKWVISRILSLPNNLEKYSDFFLNKVNKMSPDSVLNLLFNLPIEENNFGGHVLFE